MSGELSCRGHRWSDRLVMEMMKKEEKRIDDPTPDQVVGRIQELIEEGSLKAGDRLPPERDFARELGVSRASLRSGLRNLTSIGVLRVRRGVGTFVAEGPPAIGSEPLRLLGALHGFKIGEIYEARRLLEALLAGLAAERARSEHLAALADELTSMYDCFDDAQKYLVHDIRFHRAIAEAAGNPILATVLEMVSSMHFEMISKTIDLARDPKELTEMHVRIYRAIRDHKVGDARAAMTDHILDSQRGYEAATEARLKRSGKSGESA